MNMIGWLAGGGSAPLVIGLVASRSSLGVAMALASVVYVAAGLLLVIGMIFFVSREIRTGRTPLSALTSLLPRRAP